MKIIEPSPCGTVTPTYEAMFEERAVPVRSVQLSSLWTAVMSNWRERQGPPMPSAAPADAQPSSRGAAK
jgi:hypothetical protein